MIYIEMYGLPGAGKTTLSVPVVQKLREEGYRVADLSDVYFRKCNNGRKRRVIFEVLMSVKNYSLYFSAILYGLTVPRSNGIVKYLCKLLFLIHQLVKTNEEGRFDLILCEEGVIQYVSSFSFITEMPDNKALRRLFSQVRNKINIAAVNCEIGIEESYNRINNRGETSRRFSSRNDPDLLISALNAKKRNLATVSKYVPTQFLLDMTKSLQENEEALYDFLKKMCEE